MVIYIIIKNRINRGGFGIDTRRALENKIKQLEKELERSHLEQEDLLMELDEAYQKLYQISPHLYKSIVHQEKKEIIH